MRKKLLGMFAALSMLLAGVGASLTVVPAQAEAQRYRHGAGYYGPRRGYYGPRRGWRGYRGGYYGRGYRGYGRPYYRRYGYRGYRSYRGRPFYGQRY